MNEQKAKWIRDQITSLSDRLNVTKGYFTLAEESGNQTMIKSYQKRIKNLENEIDNLNNALKE